MTGGSGTEAFNAARLRGAKKAAGNVFMSGPQGSGARSYAVPFYLMPPTRVTPALAFLRDSTSVY